MRPVQLEMRGFGSFREPTVVDFTGADYFVLTGPTGSGKSTVIDAMTFALYGSVYRWNDKRTVALALAPTMGRGTVRLLFDAGGHRYVVARELRRTGTGVTVRNARLERLADPADPAGPADPADPAGPGAAEESTEVIAADSGVTRAVEELLGLTFENFCQCVVLPQGEFAEFLQAKAADRQKILLKLLGAERYEAIGREANSRASLAAQRVAVLTEQLASYGDATEEASAAAAAQVTALEELAAQVRDALPRLAEADAEVAAAQRDRDRLRAEQALLAELAVPDDVADLDTALAAGRDAVARARQKEQRAQDADQAARAALAAAPARSPLEQAKRDHAERAHLRDALPRARHEAHTAAEALRSAGAERQAAEQEWEQRRADSQQAAVEAESVATRVRQLAVEHDLLRSVSVPADVDELAARHHRARQAASSGEAAAEAAERDADVAQTARAEAPARGRLEQALHDLDELSGVRDRLPTLTAERDQLTDAQRQAAAELAAAHAAAERARQARDAATATNLAASLRPHLSVGADCPVCEQRVTTLPPPLPTDSLAAAEEALRAAERRLRQAEQAERDLAARLHRATVAHDAATEKATGAQARLTAAFAGLPGGPTGEVAGEVAAPVDDLSTVQKQLQARLEDLEELAEAARRSAERLWAARAERDRARRGLERVELDARTARAALRTCRDGLVSLGAPELDDADLAEAWRALAAWSEQQAAGREESLTHARAEAARAQQAADAASRRLAAAERNATRCRDAERAATQANERSAAALEAAQARLDALDAALTAAPTGAEAVRLLAERDRLEAAAAQSDAALRLAREAVRAAEAAAGGLDAQARDGWTRLRAVRDPLVPLGAPELDESGLLAAWTGLIRWAAEQTAKLLEYQRGGEERLAAAAAARDERTAQLLAVLTAHDIALDPGPVAAAAPAAASAALARARGEAARWAERHAEAERLREQCETAETEQQVARKLGQLLRSDGFPRWLAAAALDTLVIDASASLAELSGGQFELTHRDGEFYVVDHADADSQRSVRTLSGGETFQASLALALALSAQMSGLASAAAVSLDSIFLDEGFGSLDTATLDVVAGTLENLAHRDRMVGLVTHVPGLAERVPVRFTVSRDQRTSRIVRQET